MIATREVLRAADWWLEDAVAADNARRVKILEDGGAEIRC